MKLYEQLETLLNNAGMGEAYYRDTVGDKTTIVINQKSEGEDTPYFIVIIFENDDSLAEIHIAVDVSDYSKAELLGKVNEMNKLNNGITYLLEDSFIISIIPCYPEGQIELLIAVIKGAFDLFKQGLTLLEDKEEQ